MLKKINNYHLYILILIVFILNTILFKSIDLTFAQTWLSPPGTPGEQETHIIISPLQENLDLGRKSIVGEGSMAGELVVNAASAAKVIPANLTKDLMSGMGGGQNFAPTTIVNSAPTSSSMIIGSNSLNPISQKYFRN